MSPNHVEHLPASNCEGLRSKATSLGYAERRGALVQSLDRPTDPCSCHP